MRRLMAKLRPTTSPISCKTPTSRSPASRMACLSAASLIISTKVRYRLPCGSERCSKFPDGTHRHDETAIRQALLFWVHDGGCRDPGRTFRVGAGRTEARQADQGWRNSVGRTQRHEGQQAEQAPADLSDHQRAPP